MEKEELINELECLSSFNSNESKDWEYGFERCRELAIDSAKRLEEPQKVKVQKFVGGWLDKAKRMEVSLSEAIDYENDFISDASRELTPLQEWLSYSDNQETFARAWLDGYEVEKPKQYRIKIGSKDLYFKEWDEVFPVFVMDDQPYAINSAKLYDSKEAAEDDNAWIGGEIKEVGDSE